MKGTTKLFAILILVSTVLFAGCCINTSNMPFNGDIVFHDLSLTIPESYIRDSTQSNDDQWIFEQGNYKQLIILKRTDATESSAQDIADLMADYNIGGGLVWNIATYENAYRAEYTKDGTVCHEVIFIYGDSVYCIAMRGVTAEEFSALLDTVTVES